MPATLKSRIPQIVTTLQPRTNAAVRAGAELIVRRAKLRAPDAPPQGEGLVEAIHVEDAEEKGGYYVLAGGDDVFYGHMVEFGTAHSAPHPFLIPAAEESVGEIEGLVNAAIRVL